MVPAEDPDQAPIPPPAYHRRRIAALHLDALRIVSHLQLLALCRVAVRLAHQQCPLRCRPVLAHVWEGWEM